MLCVGMHTPELCSGKQTHTNSNATLSPRSHALRGNAYLPYFKFVVGLAVAIITQNQLQLNKATSPSFLSVSSVFHPFPSPFVFFVPFVVKMYSFYSQ